MKMTREELEEIARKVAPSGAKFITSAEEIETIKLTSIEEQEVVLSASRTDDYFKVYISDNTYLTKFKKLIQSDLYICWEGGRDKDGNITGYFFIFPKILLSFRTKVRELDEEEARVLRERLRNFQRAVK